MPNDGVQRRPKAVRWDDMLAARRQNTPATLALKLSLLRFKKLKLVFSRREIYEEFSENKAKAHHHISALVLKWCPNSVLELCVLRKAYQRVPFTGPLDNKVSHSVKSRSLDDLCPEEVRHRGKGNLRETPEKFRRLTKGHRRGSLRDASIYCELQMNITLRAITKRG